MVVHLHIRKALKVKHLVDRDADTAEFGLSKSLVYLTHKSGNRKIIELHVFEEHFVLRFHITGMFNDKEVIIRFSGEELRFRSKRFSASLIEISYTKGLIDFLETVTLSSNTSEKPLKYKVYNNSEMREDISPIVLKRFELFKPGTYRI
ncbi:hypothetical protein EV179_005984 [Coemansia sp. RSA 487]|nr:hypothetical protein EV179_005984 [Coemansia sp. RSA 487]